MGMYIDTRPRLRTSGLAVASLVLGLLWLGWVGSLLAIVFGFAALSQMDRDETLSGRGMAYAGLVLGLVGVTVLLAIVLLSVV